VPMSAQQSIQNGGPLINPNCSHGCTTMRQDFNFIRPEESMTSDSIQNRCFEMRSIRSRFLAFRFFSFR
jgi:hypothetical protein